MKFEKLLAEAISLYPKALGMPIIKEMIDVDLYGKELVAIREPHTDYRNQISAVGFGIKETVGPPKSLYTIKFVSDDMGNNLVLSEAIEIDYAPFNTNVRISKSNAIYLKSMGKLREHINLVVATPDGRNMEYPVSCRCLFMWSLDELLEKQLYFFVPYHFYHFQIKKIMAGDGNLEELEKEYAQIAGKLREAAVAEKIDINVELSLEAIMTSVLIELVYECGKQDK